MRLLTLVSLALLTAPAAIAGTPNTVQLDALDLNQMYQAYRWPMAGKTFYGRPLTLKGRVFEHGVGTHAPSDMTVVLNKQAKRLSATVGIDDECGSKGAVTFTVLVDGRPAIRTRVLHGGDFPQRLDVDLTGAKLMTLIVANTGKVGSDHADWADAVIEMQDGATARPVALGVEPVPEPVIAHVDSPIPAIHGPRITGGTPGRPFLFRIPATGKPPLRFSATGLPAGLTLNAQSGIVSGAIAKEGKYGVTLRVSGPKGSSTRSLTIVGGKNAIALTPPMGWNSWNIFAWTVNDTKVRQAADAMVSSGLASHGYQYIDIDDCWQGKRDPRGAMVPDIKFPDMKALGDYVHAAGLKFGTYSSPGPKTCGEFDGSYLHEAQDAQTYAGWGVDMLKYDYCYYSQIAKDYSRPELMKPYRVMGDALSATGRDIVFSICQYGMGQVWEWGPSVGGNLWRTAGDITDTWGSLRSIAFGQNGRQAYAGPGHWNDPDMLIVGKVGWGGPVRPTNLSRNEQITHITMWAILAAPLLIGCDMTQLDPFTIDLLTNDEVIDVDQDVLGKQGWRRAAKGDTEVYARPLSDGGTAVALFNKGRTRTRVTARWKDLGISGRQRVRDLWRRKDLGAFTNEYATGVAPHGAVMVKMVSYRRSIEH